MKKIKAPVVVCSRTFSKHAVLTAKMEEVFESVKFNREGKSLAGDDLVQFLEGAEGAIVALEKFDSNILSQLKGLKAISKYGVGLDNLDLQEMKKRNIALGWSGGVNARSVSELALGMMLSCLRSIPPHLEDLKKGVWKQRPGNTLSGKTVGVVGVGHIGKDLIRLLKPFVCRILANDLLDISDFCKKEGANPSSFENLIRESDIVSIHVPFDDSTKNLFNEKTFGLMRKNSILINTSRGGIVLEEALARALENGQLAGAASDVYSVEPPRDSALFKSSLFVGTPHVGGSSEEAILAMGMAAIENLANLFIPKGDSI